MHPKGEFPGDGGGPTPERPHVPPVVFHFGKYRAAGSVAQEGLCSHHTLVEKGLARERRGREERRGILSIHCDPASTPTPHPAIKTESDIAWVCCAKDAAERDGVVWYLALQASMFDVWIATPPHGFIRPESLLGLWDLKRMTLRGLLQ